MDFTKNDRTNPSENIPCENIPRGKEEKRRGCPYRYGKRGLDLIFSFLLLGVLFLPMVGIGFLIVLNSKGGALFCQERIGRGGKTFVCYKFRTMYAHAPHDRPHADFSDVQAYITPVGRWLRRSSLDELPQLWNVLRGDMSLVGPRPLIACEREIHVLREQMGVYELRPGMTGLAQIHEKEPLDPSVKVGLDARYAATLSFRQDLRIFWHTAKIFWKRESS